MPVTSDLQDLPSGTLLPDQVAKAAPPRPTLREAALETLLSAAVFVSTMKATHGTDSYGNKSDGFDCERVEAALEGLRLALGSDR